MHYKIDWLFSYDCDKGDVGLPYFCTRASFQHCTWAVMLPYFTPCEFFFSCSTAAPMIIFVNKHFVPLKSAVTSSYESRAKCFRENFTLPTVNNWPVDSPFVNLGWYLGLGGDLSDKIFMKGKWWKRKGQQIASHLIRRQKVLE